MDTSHLIYAVHIKTSYNLYIFKTTISSIKAFGQVVINYLFLQEVEDRSPIQQ